MSGGWDEARDATPLDDLMGTAWYVLHPQGDFIARSAWFDTLFVGSIPVVFDPGYVDHLPFADVLDYSRIMTTLPAVSALYLPRFEHLFAKRTVCSVLLLITVLHAMHIRLRPEICGAESSIVRQQPHPLLSTSCLSCKRTKNIKLGQLSRSCPLGEGVHEATEGLEQQHLLLASL